MLPIEFNNKSRQIKKAISEQGKSICRDKIYQGIIDSSLEEFTRGFMFSSHVGAELPVCSPSIPKAHIGKARRNWNDCNQIQSFVLFSTVTALSSIYISLVCSKTKNTQATSLLQAVVNYAIENKFDSIELDSLPEEKLLDWYKERGFEQLRVIFIPNTYKVKVFRMIRYLR